MMDNNFKVMIDKRRKIYDNSMTIGCGNCLHREPCHTREGRRRRAGDCAVGRMSREAKNMIAVGWKLNTTSHGYAYWKHWRGLVGFLEEELFEI